MGTSFPGNSGSLAAFSTIFRMKQTPHAVDFVITRRDPTGSNPLKEQVDVCSVLRLGWGRGLGKIDILID
jgi:hypothetical protein